MQCTILNGYGTSIFAFIGQTITKDCHNCIWNYNNTWGHNTLGDGNIIGWPIHSPILNLNFMGENEFVVIVHWQPFQMLENPFHVMKGVNNYGLQICCISH